MQECQSQLEYWKQRYKKYQNEHKSAGILAAIATKPDAWERLPRSQKWKKEYVLAVYHAHTAAANNTTTTTKQHPHHHRSYPLPNPLREPQRSVPIKIKEDIDVIKARLQSPHCKKCYTIAATASYWDSIETADLEFENIVPQKVWNTTTHSQEILEILIRYYLPRVDPSFVLQRIIQINTTTTSIDWEMASRLVKAFQVAWNHAQKHCLEQLQRDEDNRSYYQTCLDKHIPTLWMHGFPFQIRNHGRFLAEHILCSSSSNSSGSALSSSSSTVETLDWGFCQFLLTHCHRTNSNEENLHGPNDEDHEENQQPHYVGGKTTTTTLLRNDKWFAMRIISEAAARNNGAMDEMSGKEEEEDKPQRKPMPKTTAATTSPRSGGSLPDHALSLFSKRLRDDNEVVLAMVQQNGMNLKYASYKCRRNPKIVQAAIQNQSRAILYALSNCSTRYRFVRQHNRAGIQRVRQLFRDILSHRKQQYKLNFPRCRVFHTVSALYSRQQQQDQHSPTLALERKLWKELHPKIRADTELSAIAVATGIVAVEELKPSLQESSELWKIVIAENDTNWDALPTSLRNNFEFVECITNFTDELLVEEFLQDPFFSNRLASNRLFWTRVVSSSPRLDTYSLWLEHASPEFQRDREFAIFACSHDLEYWEFFKEQMPEDRDVFAAAIRCSPEALLVDVSPFTQHLFPDLVAEAIRKFETDDIWEIFDCVDEALWHEPAIVHAWVERGGDYLHEEFPESFENDEQLFLLIAEHNPSDFWCSSESLCKKKDFMLKVVAKKAILIKEAAGERLKNDFDLALVAFSGTENGGCELAGTFDIHDKDQFQFITKFAKDVRKRLQLHDSFVQLLCAMTFANSKNSVKRSKRTTPSQKCRLFMLNQGKETSIAYRKLLAEFLDVPRGEQLKMLRKASAHLARWGY
jgi:hypothetical protein